MPVARKRVVLIELSEAAAEFDVLLARDFLIAPQQDAVLEKSAVQFAEIALADVARHVKIANLGTERVRKGTQVQSHRMLRIGKRLQAKSVHSMRILLP